MSAATAKGLIQPYLGNREVLTRLETRLDGTSIVTLWGSDVVTQSFKSRVSQFNGGRKARGLQEIVFDPCAGNAKLNALYS